MEIDNRDALILVYKAVRDEIKNTLGRNFKVTDAFPDPSEAKKSLPSACIQIVNGSIVKSIMSDYEIHKSKKLSNGKWLVCTENLRFAYTLKITFFCEKLSEVQAISNKFMTFIESKQNYIKLPDDHWDEDMLIYIENPPMPPEGEPDLYYVSQEWICRGKLLIDEVVPSIDISKLKFKIESF